MCKRCVADVYNMRQNWNVKKQLYLFKVINLLNSCFRFSDFPSLKVTEWRVNVKVSSERRCYSHCINLRSFMRRQLFAMRKTAANSISDSVVEFMEFTDITRT